MPGSSMEVEIASDSQHHILGIREESVSDLSLDLLAPIISRHEISQSRFSGGADEHRISDDIISLNEDPEEDTYKYPFISKQLKYVRELKKIILLLCWLTFTFFLMMYEEHEHLPSLVTVPAGQELNIPITGQFLAGHLLLKFRGTFTHTTFHTEVEGNLASMACSIMEVNKRTGESKNITEFYFLHITETESTSASALINVELKFLDIPFNVAENEYNVNMRTLNMVQAFSMEVFTIVLAKTTFAVLIWAAILLVLIYLITIFNLIHVAFAGVLSCSLVLGILASQHLRMSLEEIFACINMNIIMNFFGVSIVMELMTETGVRDFLAALFYEMANGHIWPLLNFVFLVSWTLSTVVDDITLILLLSPICIRLCEIMHLNCTPVLGIVVIALNIGSTLTYEGCEVNRAIMSHPLLVAENENIVFFTLHMMPATFLTLVQSYLHLRIQYTDSNKLGTPEPLQIERLRRLTRVWRMVSERIGGYSLDERTAKDTVDTRVRTLRRRIKRLGKMPEPPQNFEENIKTLRDSFPIHKYPLLVACAGALFTIFLLFTLNLFWRAINVSMGWLAIIAALLALSLSNYKDLEGILSRIDWATLLLCSCLFIFMEALIRLGVQKTLGLYMENILADTSEKMRLTVAILLIIWTSALLSTLMYNVPVVTMMIPIVSTMALNEKLNLPLRPLVWALSLGCILGGNGSIMGAITNIAAAGVAAKHGYRMTYFGYFKVGFFVMVGNITLASVYLILAYGGFKHN